MKKSYFCALAVIAIIGIPAMAREAQANDSGAYQYAKNNYQLVVNNYDSSRQDFITAKNLYNKEKSTGNFKTAVEKSKNYVLEIDKSMSAYLSAVKAKIESLDNVDTDASQKIITEINSDISWYEANKTKINAISAKEDITAQVAALKNRWQDTRYKSKKYIGHILAGRLNNAIDKLETAEDKAHEKITLLKASGQNTAKLDSLETDYLAKLDTAKDQLQSGRAKFSQITSAQNAVTLFQEGKEFISAANATVREAWKILQNMIAEMKSTGKL